MSEMTLWHDQPIDDHIKPVLSSMPLRRVEDVRATDIILCPSMAWGISEVDKIKQLARPYHELGLKHDKVVPVFVVTDTEEPVCFEAGRTQSFTCAQPR